MSKARFTVLLLSSTLAFSVALAGCGAEASVAVADPADDELNSGAAAIVTFTGQDSQFYFHVKGANGERILQSEAYTSKQAAETGIASVKTNGSIRANYAVRTSADGQSYLVLTAANNEIIATSETYVSRSNAERARDRVARLFTNIKISEAPRVARFEVFQSLNDAQFYFHLRAGNGQIVLQSEGYTTRANAENGVKATVLGAAAARFVAQTAQDGRSYFVIRGGNNEIVAVSETFASDAGRARAQEAVRGLLAQKGLAIVNAE